MSNLSIRFLEQVLRVRVVSEKPIPDEKFDRATEFARAYIDDVYGEDSYWWEFSDVKRINPCEVNVVFYYMD